jgi:RNA polymerase sigma factor (sigma-70 family)
MTRTIEWRRADPLDRFLDRTDSVAMEFHETLQKAQAGDKQATYELLEIVRPHLERLAHGYADPNQACETTSDLVQEAWLRAWQSLDQFEGGEGAEETLLKFRAWVGRIVHRLGLNQQRDQRAKIRRPEGRAVLPLHGNPLTGLAGPDPVPAGDGPTPSACVMADEDVAQVQAAIAKLPSAEQRSVIQLRFFEGLSLRQAALRLGITYDTARERYERALALLERELA